MATVEALLVGATVFTGDAVGRWADALAIAGGRIAALGPEEEIGALAGPSTRVVDLHGCMVLPGFVDAHVHPPDGGRSGALCDLHELEGLGAYSTVIRAYAAAHPAAEWVLGSGWGMDDFAGGTPSRAELDALIPDRPAFLVNRDGHGAWVNTRALERAGIGRLTPDPPDGRIERAEDGEPQGTLHEGAMELVARHVPPVTVREWGDGLRRAQARLHSLGITGWQDASVTPDQLAAYRALDDAGELTARVVTSLLWDRNRGEEQVAELVELARAETRGRIRATTVKIFADGVVENFTAAMIEPYLDAAGAPMDNSGISMIEPRALRDYVARLDREGLQVHFHAIGDRAVREALDAVEAARRRNGARDARHHIAHLQVVHPDDVARFRALGVVANAQALWGCRDRQMRDLTLPFLGPERSRRQYPWRDLRRAGAVLAFGSDWPVSTPDPLPQIEVALTRRPPGEPSVPPLLPEQRLDLPDALRAFSMGAAYVNRRDRDTGSIEVGKLADLAVVDRDLFDEQAGPPSAARVVLTLVEGRPVYAEPGVW